MRRAILVLENGEIFEGFSLGAEGTTVGEVVFNTSMSGYQEIITDPSYKGQIVTMTYTEIGNYGINSRDSESDRPYVEGFAVKEASKIASNFRSEKDLDMYLVEHNIVGIKGIDTRRLTKLLRVRGSLVGAISTEESIEDLKAKIKGFDIIGTDMVKFVTSDSSYIFDSGIFRLEHEKTRKINKVFDKDRRVVVIDFGVKRNILRYLNEVGFEVYVVPAYIKYDTIVDLSPDAVFFSNGPGDPRGIDDKWVREYKKIINRFVCFGICFGHQIIARAFGIDVYKMKFGHHGGNHPVKEVESDKIFVTAQNHNYAVDERSLSAKGFEVIYKNLNDNSVEGMKHRDLPIMSVQYHPEASPGPHDAEHLFERFALLTKEN